MVSRSVATMVLVAPGFSAMTKVGTPTRACSPQPPAPCPRGFLFNAAGTLPTTQGHGSSHRDPPGEEPPLHFLLLSPPSQQEPLIFPTVALLCVGIGLEGRGNRCQPCSIITGAVR